MWVLAIEPRFSARAADGLKRMAISLAAGILSDGNSGFLSWPGVYGSCSSPEACAEGESRSYSSLAAWDSVSQSQAVPTQGTTSWRLTIIADRTLEGEKGSVRGEMPHPKPACNEPLPQREMHSL